MTINLDTTNISTVVKCSECPWWSGFADTREQGWRVGSSHEERAHKTSDQARGALRKSKTRRAARLMSPKRPESA